jgi:hypothetical protein
MKMPELAVAVQVFHVRIDDIGRFERIGRLHRQLDDAACLQVAVFDARERLALAGLDVLGIHDRARIAVHDDLHTVLVRRSCRKP